jgi:hypothetical protein
VPEEKSEKTTTLRDTWCSVSTSAPGDLVTGRQHGFFRGHYLHGRRWETHRHKRGGRKATKTTWTPREISALILVPAQIPHAQVVGVFGKRLNNPVFHADKKHWTKLHA